MGIKEKIKKVFKAIVCPKAISWEDCFRNPFDYWYRTIFAIHNVYSWVLFDARFGYKLWNSRAPVGARRTIGEPLVRYSRDTWHPVTGEGQWVKAELRKPHLPDGARWYNAKFSAMLSMSVNNTSFLKTAICFFLSVMVLLFTTWFSSIWFTAVFITMALWFVLGIYIGCASRYSETHWFQFGIGWFPWGSCREGNPFDYAAFNGKLRIASWEQESKWNSDTDAPDWWEGNN